MLTCRFCLWIFGNIFLISVRYSFDDYMLLFMVMFSEWDALGFSIHFCANCHTRSYSTLMSAYLWIGEFRYKCKWSPKTMFLALNINLASMHTFVLVGHILWLCTYSPSLYMHVSTLIFCVPISVCEKFDWSVFYAMNIIWLSL